MCNIVIKGNKQTKSYIILRELQLEPGDLIPVEKLNDILEKARNQVYNTTLFI
ncbi:MAG: POTRA domain-containing protein, partial [Ginsengibacter sp.]